MQATIPLQYRPARGATVRRRPSAAVYRRRRLAVLLSAAAIVALTVIGLHRLTGSSGDGPLTGAGQPVSVLHASLVTSTRVIVQPGDTLWTIARRVQPTGDVRPLVASIEAKRHGQPLQVGETIQLHR